MTEPADWIKAELDGVRRALADRRHRERRAEEMRGEVCWWMTVEDLQIGHAIGFDYPVSGDRRPRLGA